MSQSPIVLTGDRPTGPLHLGHYVGSLRQRMTLQEQYRQFVMIADAQALTDNMGDLSKVRRNVIEVALDYLAVGLDPAKSTMFIQSQLTELAELSFYLLNLVTVARLERNPTVKEEIRLRGMERDIPAGFLTYPVSQTADITAFKAALVPVGADQAPMIEQCNELVRRFNNCVGRDILVEAQALIPDHGRLVGADGGAKMSKSLGNALALSADSTAIAAFVRSMYTDPNHLRVNDPGQVEGNVVFTYLDVFDPDKAAVEELKDHYRRGGLGDTVLKRRLTEHLEALITPIRERRAQFAQDPAEVMNILRQGTERAREAAAATMGEVKAALGLSYWD